MNTATALSLVCQHQSELSTFLESAGVVMPVASLVTWATARWRRIPPGLQTILQLLAGNLAHAILGEPLAPVLSSTLPAATPDPAPPAGADPAPVMPPAVPVAPAPAPQPAG